MSLFLFILLILIIAGLVGAVVHGLIWLLIIACIGFVIHLVVSGIRLRGRARTRR